jgi:Cys-tRNA(Pro)/Cys-tRNA(Cys) deacylase
MNPYEQKLLLFIEEHDIQAEHLSFEQSCRSVAEAAQAVNASPEDLVKNICLIDTHGQPVIAIVKGEDRVSTSRIAQALTIDPPRMATAEEILEKTGYPCGGTPSFGYQATFLIDPRVMEKEVVFTGGGSETSLVKIAPQELVRANKGTVVRIRK